ncbi:MAG: T9SS type A sorting domain-containing protein [Bacteroidales bacterium]|nr:T9SS type A sorting domain-containing protein [Bacteroidales bacterium]
MKTRLTRLLAVAAMLFISTRVEAQYIYHNVGDTIMGRDTIYFDQWTPDEYLADSTHTIEDIDNAISDSLFYLQHQTPVGDGIDPDTSATRRILSLVFTGEILRYCYTDHPIEIVGLAAAIEPVWMVGGAGQSDQWHTTHDPDSTWLPEYLLLYTYGERDSFNLAKQVRWRKSDPVRYMKQSFRNLWGYYEITPWDRHCCNAKFDHEWYVPVHEYYFDKPVTVTDSFYVGWTQYSNRILVPWHLLEGENYETGCNVVQMHVYNHLFKVYGEMDQNYNIDYCDSCATIPLFRYKYLKERELIFNHDSLGEWRWYPQMIADPVWRWEDNHAYALVFPIVKIDTQYAYRCPVVSNLHVEQTSVLSDGSNCAVLMWNSIGAADTTYEVCFGPAGTPPEDCTRMYSAYNAKNICGLDSCEEYVVYVRAKCHRGAVDFYGEWSEGLRVKICDDTMSGEGIGDIMEQLVRVVPNPATTQVRVLSSYTLSRVEVFDLQGNKVLDQPAFGLTATFPVRDWPKGMYIVVVHTPAGTASKKLVVD